MLLDFELGAKAGVPGEGWRAEPKLALASEGWWTAWDSNPRPPRCELGKRR
jgi:hypothetical protein